MKDLFLKIFISGNYVIELFAVAEIWGQLPDVEVLYALLRVRFGDCEYFGEFASKLIVDR